MRRNDPIVIVCATDARYVPPLATMLRSVSDNLDSTRSVVAYVLHSGVSSVDRDRVAHCLPADRFQIHWIPVDSSMVTGVPVWGRMPVSTYFKLLVPDVLPPEIKRALWLDCDLIATRNVGELWDIDLDGCLAGAVQDSLVPVVSSRHGIARWSRLGMTETTKYFNAGVMLIDVARWRVEQVASTALDYLRRNWESVVFWDQEGLNVALAGRWKELRGEWNLNVSLPRWRKTSLQSAAILHYAGRLKPWLYRTQDPAWSLYIGYLDETSWSGMRPESSLYATAISLYERSRVRLLVHPLENAATSLVRKLSRGTAERSRAHVAAPVHVENR